jgi:hypothetical protein
VTGAEAARIEPNLFKGARWVLTERPAFPWHRDRTGAVTASRAQSSQALALDVFGTIERLRSRDAIIDAWADTLDLPMSGPWSLETEHLVPGGLLGEPRRSQLDALATGQDGLVAFECKFTEPGGGTCSQTKTLSRGAHRGLRQCDGSYHVQTNPVTRTKGRCALTAKGVKYWSLVPEVLAVDPEVDYQPCPFAGEGYQWMRNLVSARALSAPQGVAGAFVLAYADGPFPVARHVRSASWTDFLSTVRPARSSASARARYLVEAVQPAPRPEDQTLVRLSCLEDDAEGEELEVLWEKEVDAQRFNEADWTKLAQGQLRRPAPLRRLLPHAPLERGHLHRPASCSRRPTAPASASTPTSSSRSARRCCCRA